MEALPDNARYLNKQLQMLGFATELDFCSPDPSSISLIMKCIYSLISQRQKDTQMIQELRHRSQEQDQETKDLTHKLQKTTTELTLLDKEFKETFSKLGMMKESNDLLLNQMNSFKDQLKNEKHQFQFHKHQTQVELRKQTLVIDKLKSRISGSFPRNERCLRVSSPILVNPKYKNGNDDVNSLTPQVMKSMEIKIQEFIKENFGLKEFIKDMFYLVDEILRKCLSLNNEMILEFDKEKEKFIKDVDGCFENRNEACFKSFSFLVHSIEDFCVSRKQEGDEIVDEKIRELEHQLEEQQSIICKQMKLLEISMKLDNNTLITKEDDSLDDIDTNQLYQSTNELIENQKKLEKERKDFTDAAIKLGRERSLFEKEKQLFGYESELKSVNKAMDNQKENSEFKTPIDRNKYHQQKASQNSLNQQTKLNSFTPSTFTNATPLLEFNTIISDSPSCYDATPIKNIKSALRTSRIQNSGDEIKSSKPIKGVKIDMEPPRVRVIGIEGKEN